MPSEDLTATTDVVTLADHVDGLGQSVARRLDDNGVETVADILIADEGALTDVPYVSETRADLLRETADEIADDSEVDPLVDPREVVIEATLGEKLTLTMADREGYANPWAVVDTEEPTTWEAPTGDTWQTRRIRISQKMSGAEHYTECDLVLGADEIRLEDPPVKRQDTYSNAVGWRVESVGAIGRVERSTLAQLQGRQQQADAKPEGDDTWRRYQNRGETA